MKTLQGTPDHIRGQRIGILTRTPKTWPARRHYILLATSRTAPGYAGAILAHAVRRAPFAPAAVSGLPPAALADLHDGDILALTPDGTVAVLWDGAQQSNGILMTERCNCRCLMCPQPPKEDAPGLDETNDRLLQLLPEIRPDTICITGGEPTLKRTRFLKTLDAITRELPQAAVDILTNGQTFADFEFARAAAECAPARTTFCISLHADTAALHNRITGSTDGFARTLRGIRNLGKLGIPVEIRFVLMRLNHDRVAEFARFVGQNFPFVVHVALMGLEMTGKALENEAQVWVEPAEYAGSLRIAIQELRRRNVPASIYNVPLCLLDRRVWPAARQSISAWKNGYLPACESCQGKTFCCGVFTTSERFSQRIRPVDPADIQPLQDYRNKYINDKIKLCGGPSE
ncbi:MAG: His-Xaa-Ser system radical SAM maturase HxsC [Desulfovibrionaceae bacterium]